MVEKLNVKNLGMGLMIIFLFSCASQTREQKMAQYFRRLGVPETAFVGLLNPGYCGSCTDYSINYLASGNITGKKVIVTTGELTEQHAFRLKKAGYSFLKGDQNTMARNGITLTACTIIQLNNGEIESMKVIK